VNDWDLTFERSELDDGVVLAVRGEIDVAVAARFGQELSALGEATRGKVIVDLSAVGFIDSSGIRELLNAQRRLQSTGAELVLLAPSAPCRRVLEVSGASVEFAIFDTLG